MNQNLNIITKDAQDKSDNILKLQDEIYKFQSKELNDIDEKEKSENNHNVVDIIKYKDYFVK